MKNTSRQVNSATAPQDFRPCQPENTTCTRTIVASAQSTNTAFSQNAQSATVSEAEAQAISTEAISNSTSVAVIPSASASVSSRRPSMCAAKRHTSSTTGSCASATVNEPRLK